MAELFASRAVARLIGVGNVQRACGVLRTCGIRELVTGVALLAQPRSAAWAWSRIVGDVLDLALLGQALQSRDAKGKHLAAAAAAVAGVTAVDAFSAVQQS